MSDRVPGPKSQISPPPSPSPVYSSTATPIPPIPPTVQASSDLRDFARAVPSAWMLLPETHSFAPHHRQDFAQISPRSEVSLTHPISSCNALPSHLGFLHHLVILRSTDNHLLCCKRLCLFYSRLFSTPGGHFFLPVLVIDEFESRARASAAPFVEWMGE